MKLSIITINYNNREGLQRTINSVIFQTWRDFEWIVIDGGSTDGSKELIEQYQEHFAYWCSEPDKGIFNAMNKGTEHAKGEYLIFLNSGDEFYDNSVLHKMASSHHKSDIISGYAKRNDCDDYTHRHRENITVQLFFSSISHQATFIKRDVLKRYMYDENLKMSADWKFWLQAIVIEGCSFEFSDIVVAKMDMTGITSSPFVDRGLQKAERQKVLHSLFSDRIIENMELIAKYEEIPTIKYIVALWSRSYKMFVVAHGIVKFLSRFVRIRF